MTTTTNSASSAFETVGVNGSDVYTTPVGDSQELLALFGSLNRTMPVETLQRLLEAAYNDTTKEDLTVLAFHTRDILEGKGERALFYRMIWFLYQKDPTAIHKVLCHVSHYGAWLDLQKLIEYSAGSAKENDLLVQTIVELYAKQLLADAAAVAKTENGGKLSLAAKWVPRENKRNGWLAHKISRAMFPHVSKLHRLKLYRQLVSKVNARLDTVERKMCHDAQKTHHFADIDPAKVPSRCLLLKRPAFFNEPPKKKQKLGAGVAAVAAAMAAMDENEDGDEDGDYGDDREEKKASLRHPDDPDRMACRERFLAHVEKALAGKAKVHGKVLMPHEFVIKAATFGRFDTTGWDTLQAQWNDLRDTVRARQSLGKTVVMCDFSGSMNGMPMNVSKGLGLLCAECTSPAFRDRLLTFDSTPTWHNLARAGPTLKERLISFAGVSQGLSTNFQAAVDLVLHRLVEAQVPVGDEPDILLVLTDMGWDAANNKESYGYRSRSGSNTSGNFETHIERIRREFAAQGGWKVPTIVIWNISGKFQEYHHQSTTPGVCLVSGWSPAILKYIMQGDDLVAKLQTLTPFKLMRQVLDDARYTPIRDTLKSQSRCVWASEGEGDWVKADCEGDCEDWGTSAPVDWGDWGLESPPSPSMPGLCSDKEEEDEDKDIIPPLVAPSQTETAADTAADTAQTAAQTAESGADEIKSSCRLT